MLTQVLIIIGLSLIGVLGDYFLKLAGSGNSYIQWSWFLLGTVIYSSTAIGWFFVMKNIKLGTLGIVYTTTTVLALTIVGFIFFRENLNYYEVGGLILGMLSIILLARFV